MTPVRTCGMSSTRPMTSEITPGKIRSKPASTCRKPSNSGEKPSRSEPSRDKALSNTERPTRRMTYVPSTAVPMTIAASHQMPISSPTRISSPISRQRKGRENHEGCDFEGLRHELSPKSCGTLARMNDASH